MRKLLSALLLCTCIVAHSQNEFDVIKDEVNEWYATITSTSTIKPKAPKSIDYSSQPNSLIGLISDISQIAATSSQFPKPPKTIDFPAQHYSIVGIISKGILCEGTFARFYDTSSLAPTLLLEGKVSYYDNRLIVEGIKYAGTNKIYGTFYVYNMDDFSMKYKHKKAGALRLKCSNASYLEGFYLKCPVIVRLNEYSTIYVDGQTGGRGYSFLSAVIPDITFNDDDSFDLYQILLQAKDDVTMCWENGTMFEGIVKPTIREDSAIVFQTLDGKKTGMTSGPKEITVSHENGNIVYTQKDNDDNQLLSKETLYVKDDGTISEKELWNLGKIYEHCYHAQWTYRNGDYFEGTINSVITPENISSKATNGVFKYSNGDVFKGNLTTKNVGPFFTDGTTSFIDGTTEKGNWLGKYKLSNNQLGKVYKCQNPTSARTLAKKLVRSNYYQDYKYAGSLEYFNPNYENKVSISTWDTYLTYDKTNHRYSCSGKTDKKIEVVFTIDNKGFRQEEIVYGSNNKPEFINKFTWYSNGEIESIKSYSYGTKHIYLACNFFSDGKLRSAYQYCRGNSGENILRKSKESHPTLRGYTCKLYDLNGNYERSIDWDIGIGVGLFGETYNKDMAPSRFEFDELKPLE